jgi:hypothetical protein
MEITSVAKRIIAPIITHKVIIASGVIKVYSGINVTTIFIPGSSEDRSRKEIKYKNIISMGFIE